MFGLDDGYLLATQGRQTSKPKQYIIGVMSGGRPITIAAEWNEDTSTAVYFFTHRSMRSYIPVRDALKVPLPTFSVRIYKYYTTLCISLL